MPKPVCIPCQRFFRPLRNGVYVLEQKPKYNGDPKWLGKVVPPGNSHPELWEPYKTWMADSWKCEGCGTTIVTGFGFNPLWEDYKGPLPEGEYLPVNDC